MTDALRLTRDLTMPFARPQWPAGVTEVPFSATLAPRVHALMRLAYGNGGGTVPADFDTWWAATRHDPEFDANLCIVAVTNGEPVGFALCWTSSFVKDLVVHPDWRQKGLGTALLLRAFELLAARGCNEVALKVLADNMTARRLYVRLGFRKD